MNHIIRMTAAKIGRRLDLIAPLVYRYHQPLQLLRFKAMNSPMEALPLDPDFDDSDWQVIPMSSYWGGQNINFVMRGQFAVPPTFDPNSPVALFLPLGDAGEFSHPEALIYIDGEPYATTDRHHQECLLAPQHRSGRFHHLLLHGWTGFMGSMWRMPDKQLFMHECAVVSIHQPTRDFLVVARAALQTATLLDDLEPAKSRLFNALDAACKRLDTREPFTEAFYDSIPCALQTLCDDIAQAGPPLDVEIVAAGHAHIDVAWLWTLAQTRGKVGRTFHTVLRQMEQFPNYHFTQSQPQLYAYVQEDYPALFAAIKQRIAEGRWEPIGGMWVEADCNITGSESLARQFLLGRTFFREQFGPGVESPVLWLPDVFGYAWNLPQLLKSAGLEFFFTIKTSWNQYNQMPYDSFWWQGLDGTKVLTHFSTTPGSSRHNVPTRQDLENGATYNANLTPFAVLGSWAKLKHKDVQRVMLMSYGYGDGGGGPTREMNEYAQVLQSFPALPRVQQGKVIDFFRRLQAESGDQLPVWNNELYLELHRGTYTTQSRNKRAHRKAEFRLHDAEYLATLAALLDTSYIYPHETLRAAWRLNCLNQFHDIIPGSSIHAVYAESQQQYEQIAAMTTAVAIAALSVIEQQTGGDVLLINPTGFSRYDLAFWDGTLPLGHRFAGDVYTQAITGGTLIACADVPAYSVQPLTLVPGDVPSPDPTRFSLVATPTLLENAYLVVVFNEAGDIVRIFDKVNQRDVLPSGALANQFQAFEDRPLAWDAWDIDIFYDDKLFLAEPAHSIQVVECGPLRATLEIQRRILNSVYTQRISLTYNSPQLLFDTTIQWQERHILLKTAFPVEVLAPVATYEIQWGNVQRPTHRNTSWDWARFETAAQKWVDLSEGGYGVALINDCKYGHDIRDNVIRLSLLRAPTQPDPEADQGEHHFAYSLYPHANADGGLLVPSDVAQIAYPFNDPMLVVTATTAPAQKRPSLVTLPAHVIVETIKQAEDGNGVIVRFYECNRQRGVVTLHAGFALQAAYLCNLLEEEQETLLVMGNNVDVPIKPFQIMTMRLIPA